MVVDAVALKLVEPGRALDVLAAVLVPGDVELGLLVVAQDLGGTSHAPGFISALAFSTARGMVSGR